LLPADGLISSSEAPTSSSTAKNVHSVTTIEHISLPCESKLGSTLHTEREWKIFISSYTLPAKEPGTHEAIILDDCRRHTAAYTRSSAISYYSLDTNFWRFLGIGPTVMRTAIIVLRSKTVVCGHSAVASYVFIFLITSRNIKVMPDEIM